MSTETVKIGLAGCGWICANGHVPAIRKLEGVEIISVFDSDIERANSFSENFAINNAFDDYDKFLQSGIDAVFITTPNFTHAKYSLIALENNKHILCEKPFTINSKETQEIIEAAKRNNKLAIPGFVSRFRNDVVKLREKVINNDIGTIRRIEAGWIRKSGIPRPGTWFTKKELSGGGVLIDLGSHIIDLCLMLAGKSEIETVSLLTAYNQATESSSSASWFEAGYNNTLHIDVENTAIADIKLSDGCEIQVKLSWAAPVEGDCTYFTIYGDKGILKLKTLFGFSKERLLKEDVLVSEIGGTVETLSFNCEDNRTEDAFNKMARFFVNAIAQGKESDYLKLSDAYNTVKLIENLYACEKRSDSICEKLK